MRRSSRGFGSSSNEVRAASRSLLANRLAALTVCLPKMSNPCDVALFLICGVENAAQVHLAQGLRRLCSKKDNFGPRFGDRLLGFVSRQLTTRDRVRPSLQPPMRMLQQTVKICQTLVLILMKSRSALLMILAWRYDFLTEVVAVRFSIAWRHMRTRVALADEQFVTLRCYRCSQSFLLADCVSMRHCVSDLP